ncbi:tRNA (adenosine(37)-N6)-threonylcarbamoyltransferase complex dimerization subunit type 1 TsaB [Actinoallomurus sp. NBC_01490]|uniref:tRNA (adenosine(37)-N6)-threonylcarbamoyltransferase complex dimerization subunit type 1 TsaB n=1 Tax=Actinoallomurus sp. NBC_01490 TaxID=2903557 RepID=UPI002E352918|nr:tRNA (adenosine(37)-N6)-threonylcarbamoyltransferase complex dimerization subunit type 1 TsaB [Actinoallomurus sp. NBC_01490]
MLVLAFDTATAAVTVALSEWAPGETPRLRAESKVVDRRRHAEVLAPAIDTVLGDARVSREELSAIAVGVGPGPYTGLRVGLVTARSLGAVLQIPVHGVCTLDALAWESKRTDPFVVATDARRKEVYWARYDSATVRTDGPSVGKPADAAVPGLPALGEGALLYPEVLKGETPALPSAAAIAELVVSRLSGGEGPDLLPPEPLYLRKPDAREPGPRKRVTPG